MQLDGNGVAAGATAPPPVLPAGADGAGQGGLNASDLSGGRSPRRSRSREQREAAERARTREGGP
eukprot:8830492-Pyramimonas_sp.AAC.1